MSAEEYSKTTAPSERTEKIESDFIRQEIHKAIHSISHELHAPIRSIINFTSILKQKTEGRLESNETAWINFIEEAGLQAQTIIRHLITYSRLLDQEPEESAVDLSELVGQILRQSETKIAPLNAEVTVAELPSISANRKQLFLLFKSLIDNALDYHRPNIAPHIKIDHEFCLEKNQLIILIDDNGTGVPEALWPEMTDIFKTEPHQSQHHGFGMGLAYCKQICIHHQAQLCFNHSPLSGLRVEIKFPVKRLIKE